MYEYEYIIKVVWINEILLQLEQKGRQYIFYFVERVGLRVGEYMNM